MTALLAFPASALGAAGDISTVAGNGTSTGAGDGGLATSASLVNPRGVAVGPSGEIYVADYGGHKVRKFTPGGTITTFAGDGVGGSSGDGGPATSARLRNPSDVAVDAVGNVYISDSLNHRIRLVSPGGTISTYAGSTNGYAGDGGPATAARFATPEGIALDAAGNLYIADFDNNRVRKINTGGTITTVAGTGTAGSGGDGGQATSATLNNPSGAVVDAAGNLYIVEYDGKRVRKVATDGTISRFAGTGGGATTGNGGPATSAQMNQPWDVETDANGNVYISELGGHVVRKVSSLGIISAFAGTGSSGFAGDGAAATSAQLNGPGGIEHSPEGHLYIADYTNRRIRRVEAATPPAPTVGATSPTSPANGNTVNITGSAATGSTVTLYTNSTCTSAVAGSGTAAAFGSTGIAATVADNSTTTFYATASNDAGASACSSTSVTYVEDSAAPAAPTISSAPAPSGSDRAPSWSFSGEAGATLECQLVGPDDTWTWAACTSGSRSYDLTGKADGTYTFSVRAKDAANNTGTAQTSTYVLDTTAPPDPAVNAPASPSSDATPQWTFAATGATGYECRVDQGVVLDDWASCASPWTYDLSGKPDGTYTVKIRSRDAVGNRSTGVATTYELDRSLPAAPTIDSSPGPLGGSRSPEWSFSTSESGMTFECELQRGTTEISAWGDCLNPRQYSLTGEDDGVYTFSVRAKNGAGTRGAAATSTYELDTTAPAAPAVGSEPAAIGSGRSPAWSFTAEAGSTVRCRVTRGTTEIAASSICTSPHTVDLTGQDDGIYTLTLFARDTAGNDSTTTTRTYELDTAGPGAPSFTSSERTPGNVRLPSWSWAGGGAFECSLTRPGGAADDWAPCTSPAARDLAGQPDGRYELRVRGVDTAGNRGAIAAAGYELDTQPGALALTGGPAPVSRAGAATFTWTGEANASFRCRTLRGGDVRTDWAPCSSPHEIDIAGDPDGAYTFAVTATDSAGNASPDATWTFGIDRTPPATATYDEKPPARARDRTPSWTFASDPGARYECRVEEGRNVVSDWAGCVSPLRIDLRNRDDGAYSLLVRAIDEAGNVAAPVTTTYRLDTTEPAAPELTDKPGSDGTDRTPTWAFRGESRSELECRLKADGKEAPAWRACESPKTYDLESEPDGTYTFFVRARDIAGNTGAAAADPYRLRAEAVAASNGGGGNGSQGGPSPTPNAGPAAPAPGAPGPGDPLAADGPESPTDGSDDREADDSDAATKSGGAADRRGAGAGPGEGAAAAARAQSAGSAGADEAGRKRRRRKGNVAQETFKKVGKVVAAIAEEPAKTAFPMSLIFVVSGFMGLQGRIDRNDPKLALAPVFADPDLEFRPPHDARAGSGNQ